MPYAQCPRCGSIFHLSVGDVEEWYRKHDPNTPVWETVSDICFTCWKADQDKLIMPPDHQQNPEPN